MSDIIIVGAGTGGLSVARELSKNPDVNIKIIEKGIKTDAKDAYNYYDVWDKEDLELLRTIMVGGSSVVIAGNFIPTLTEKLKEYDIDIQPQLDQLEHELNIMDMPDSHVGEVDKLLEKSAKELGLDLKPMPKAINPDKCIQCGRCALGCPNDAKWSSLKDLEIALENGAKLITDEEVTDLIIEDNKVIGVKTNNANTFAADAVVVAAGGVITPKLLKRAGINAGSSLAVDPFVTIGGYRKNTHQDSQIQMNKYIKLEDAIISPHTSQYILPKIQKTHPDATVDDVISFMVKIPDKTTGHITNNTIAKYIDHEDVAKIAKGCGIATAILIKAGADIESISSTHLRGAHLVSSAKIGEVVDSNLETEIEDLYVADGSVLPTTEGIPPIYTILALSRRLGQYLHDKY